MSKTFAGYGRYDDDPSHVGCPRANSDMTPCVARDGLSACEDQLGVCVGCGQHPGVLLKELVVTVTDTEVIKDFVSEWLDEHYPDAQLMG